MHSQFSAAEGLDIEAQAFIARFLGIHDAQTANARAELDRLRGLIDDAGCRLMASFDVIGATASRSDQAQAVEHAVGEAVSALQFQDMASQLIGHVAQRIAVLEQIAGLLIHMPEISVDDLSDAVAGTVVERNDGPVAQACVSGGSVDLF